MDDNQANSRETPSKESTTNYSAAQQTPINRGSQFKRTLVPLDEYAARQGISSDTVEKQGQLGVIQVRKFKGKKFVVDAPVEQFEESEEEQQREIVRKSLKAKPTLASKAFTVVLTAGLMVIIVSVFWLYMDAKQKLDDLNVEYASLQKRFDDLANSDQNTKAVLEELANSKAEYARIQNQIASSKTELERIQADLNKARRNLETIQTDLTNVQGQLSLSKVEIESTQNGLGVTKNDLEKLHQQNTEQPSK
jgi:septal ring factor EnvC (AmiA/AmiB activator)